MKKIKRLFSTMFILFICLIAMDKVEASTGSITISRSRSSMIVGNSVTMTVTLSSSSVLGSWQFDVYYDSSRLRLTSSSFGGMHVVSYGDGAKKSVSYTYTFVAIAPGTANVITANASAYDWDLGTMNLSTGAASVGIITQAQLEASYSKNNNLSSLGIEGYQISPSFDKNILEYSVVLDSTVEKININANKEDGTASISGNGEVAVSEGENKLSINVTAQNGNVKKYVINATVKELNPINVKIGNNEYTVVKKASLLEMPSNYIAENITIASQEVPSFKSEITGYRLVGLKDSEGNIGLYVYDATNSSYTPYNELKFNSLTLYMMDYDNSLIPSKYNKYDMSIKDKTMEVYKITKNSKYALLYGMNVETVDIGLYLYDSKEQTLQSYYKEEIELLASENEIMGKTILILGISTFTAILLLILACLKKSVNKEKKEERKQQKEEKRQQKRELKDLKKQQKEEKLKEKIVMKLEKKEAKIKEKEEKKNDLNKENVE